MTISAATSAPMIIANAPADDRNAHRAFVATLGSGAVWLDYSFKGLERRSRAFG
jgi:hypothetical protein